MGKVSVVINTLNEEKNISSCISSVKTLVDEIVVVDMHSGDDTVKIARKLGAEVYRHKRTGYVEPARNYAISKAKNEWILLLDADEKISKSFATEIKKLIKKQVEYYRVPRKNIIFGKWIKNSRWWPDYNIRLFKKGKVSWADEIHSIPITQGTGEELPSEEKFAIIHNHYTSVSQYVERINRYTSVQANSLLKEKRRASWKDFIDKPAGEFFARYFQGEGYKDGIHGIALSMLQAFSELVVYIKVWEGNKFVESDIEIEKVSKKIGKIQKDLNYWKADMLYKSTKNVFYAIKRKFRLS